MLLVSQSSVAGNGGPAPATRERRSFIEILRSDPRVAIKFWHSDCVNVRRGPFGQRGRSDRTRLRKRSATLSRANQVRRHRSEFSACRAVY